MTHFTDRLRGFVFALGLAVPLVLGAALPAHAQQAAGDDAIELTEDELKVVNTPPLLTLLENGLTLIRMGDEHGFEAWMGRADNGSPQTYYLTPDRQAMIAGIMYDAKGVRVTEWQIRRRLLELSGQAAPPRPTGSELASDAPVTPHAAKWRTSPPVFRLARQGVNFTALPIEHGVEVFLGIAPKSGTEQTFYLSPDNKALVVGILYDAKGQDITWKQIYKYAQEKASAQAGTVELAPAVVPAPNLRIEPAPAVAAPGTRSVTTEDSQSAPLRSSPLEADAEAESNADNSAEVDGSAETVVDSAASASASPDATPVFDPDQSRNREELRDEGTEIEQEIEAFFKQMQQEAAAGASQGDKPAVDLTRSTRIGLPEPGEGRVRVGERRNIFDSTRQPEQAVQQGIEGRLRGVDPTAELPPIEEIIPAPRIENGRYVYRRSADPTLGARSIPARPGMADHAMRNRNQGGLNKAVLLAKGAAVGMQVKHGPLRPPTLEERDYSDLPFNKAMQAAIEDTFWFSYGREGAPIVYVIFDPACPWCEQGWEDMRPLIERGAFEARIILTSFLAQLSLPRSAAILDADDPIKALEQYHGRMADTPVEISEQGVREVQYNNLVVRRLRLSGTPFFLFENDKGEWTQIRGLPRSLAAELVSNLPDPKPAE